MKFLFLIFAALIIYVEMEKVILMRHLHPFLEFLASFFNIILLIVILNWGFTIIT